MAIFAQQGGRGGRHARAMKTTDSLDNRLDNTLDTERDAALDAPHADPSSDVGAASRLDPSAQTAWLVARVAERGLLPILDDVCQRGHVTREEILGKSRARHIVKARQELWWCLRRHANNFSLHEIGKLFLRHHTSVLAGVRAHDQKVQRRNRVTSMTRGGYAPTFEFDAAPGSMAQPTGR